MLQRAGRRLAGRAAAVRACVSASRSPARARAPRRSAAARGAQQSASRAASRVAPDRGDARVAPRRVDAAARARVNKRSSLRSGSGAVTSRSRSWQSPARFAFTAPSRAAISARNASRSPLARGCAGRCLPEHAASGPDRIERVGLAARATLPPQPADLEHPLAATGEKARQTGAERAGALDREHTPARRVPSAKRQQLRVALAARGELASNTTAPLRTSTTANACVSRCGSTPIT